MFDSVRNGKSMGLESIIGFERLYLMGTVPRDVGPYERILERLGTGPVVDGVGGHCNPYSKRDVS